MARTFTPRVNRHVQYVRTGAKLVSATITAVGSTNGGIVLRVGRGAQAVTYGDATTGILRSTGATTVGTYRVV